jgi:hypothetical protein
MTDTVTQCYGRNEVKESLFNCSLTKPMLTLSHAFFWVIPRRLNFICRRFGTLFHLHTYAPINMEQSVPKRWNIKFRPRKNYPEESIQHSEDGESLKSRTTLTFPTTHKILIYVAGRANFILLYQQMWLHVSTNYVIILRPHVQIKPKF